MHCHCSVTSLPLRGAAMETEAFVGAKTEGKGRLKKISNDTALHLPLCDPIPVGRAQ